MLQMKRLCFGGSFNPPHLGHTRCAAAVAAVGGFDRVVLIPAAVSPHKLASARDLAPGPDRWEMCRLAAAEFPGLIEISDVDLSRPAPSYTIDTVRLLKSRGWDRLSWLIGADQLQALPRWHKALDLIDEVQFVIMARPGFTLDFQALPREFRRLRDHVVEVEPIDVSATEVRQRVRDGESISHMVCPAVAAYIAEKQLYR